MKHCVLISFNCKAVLKKFLILIFILQSLLAVAQKEANVWYFGKWAGLDFNQGEPNVIAGIYNDDIRSGNICDSLGNFIIGTNGYNIYNRLGNIMQNGQDIISIEDEDVNAVIVQKPGSNNLYYVFMTVYWDDYPMPFGLYYSVVDLDMDNGLGAVTNEKGILIDDAYDAEGKLVAVRHKNGKDIWIIVRKVYESGYASFLLTSNGIFNDYVFSPSDEVEANYLVGDMKVSFDKKMLVAAYRGMSNMMHKPKYEICDFDASTGKVDFKYNIMHLNDEGYAYEPRGVEFSPDSKYLYLSGRYNDELAIYQHQTRYINDSAQFFDSGVLISNGPGHTLQLARDGQIYCTGPAFPVNYRYVSIIHKPWKVGLDCDYEADVIDLDFDNQSRMVQFYYPNQLIDYLYRFEWQGQCQSEQFQFQSNFQPIPTLIAWDFDDPGSGSDNYSNDLNPVHYFTHPGEFEVSVYVKYPSGRVEQTSRVVTVEDIPHPNLGPGYVVCEGDEVTLYAGDEEGMYAWSTGEFGQNLNEITVSDSGWYWVQVTAELGCFGIDSVYVGWYPKAVINEDNLQLVPTTCGGSNGKILGLEVSGTEPLSFEWYNADSALLDTTLDLTGLPVGNYFLHILDGNDCITISNAYTIEDAGNIEVTAVEKEDSHCEQNNGAITITAQPAANLQYSIDDRVTWQNDSHFENLPAGEYKIWARDPSGCEGVYADNPVVIKDISGPQVTQVTTVPEIDNLSNGEIDISATVDTGQVYYSIDNGATFQTDDGHFTNLTAGTYNCVIKDDLGCDTAFAVELERVISQLIEAIAGDGATCIGNAAVVPLKLVNFKDIYKFHVTLTYDTALLTCDGYMKVHPVLKSGIQVSIIPGSNEVIVSWQGDKPETLDDNATMLELVFRAKKEGLSGIDWAAEAGQSAFFNEQLDEVNAKYHLGILAIYRRPKIMLNKEEDYCEGDDVSAFVLVNGGSGEIEYFWEGPNGFTGTTKNLEINHVQTSQQGIYTLTVTDTLDCQESKELNLIIYKSPQIDFAGIDTLFAQPGFVLDAGSGYQSYLWNTGDTTDAITVNEEGQYWVTVTSEESCRSADTVTVFWGGQPFYLPNAFTPNGDGLNDEFKPVQRYDFVKTYHLYIYNRWGQLIFEITDINTGWDGAYKGNPAPQGTYVYKIVYTASSTGNGSQSVSGNVTLVR